MKKYLILTTVFFLFSCSGYFSQDDQKGGDTVQPLALSGGGYLSSDTANDITPFLFHDTNTGRNWLFFSSDRNGNNYDIYYAELLSNGKFGNPVPMDANINTVNNEYSPVVFYGYNMMIGTNYLFLSYITASGGTTNINTVQLTGSLSWYANQTAITTNTTRIALFNATNISPSLIYSLGSTNWGLYVWYSYPPPPWFSGTIYNLNQTVFSPIMDMNGYSVNSTNYYILDIKSGNVDQIYFAVNGTGMTSNLSKISAYASQYNDKDPFIDLATMQVYFSSDRNGKGNFDLYRYNVKTFDKVIK